MPGFAMIGLTLAFSQAAPRKGREVPDVLHSAFTIQREDDGPGRDFARPAPRKRGSEARTYLKESISAQVAGEAIGKENTS